MNRTERADAIRAFYDADASGYFQHRWNRSAVTRADYATTRDILIDLLRPQPGARLLEVGCGPGTWTEVVVARGASVTALDISERMLEEAARRVPGGNASFVRMDFAKWEPSGVSPAGENLFDGAYTVRVFEHLEDKPASLQRLRRVLRPGGRAVIITKTMPSIWNGRVRIMRAIRQLSGRSPQSGAGGEQADFWMERATPWKLARMMRYAGFVGVGVTPVILRPPLFSGGESEYPIISSGLAQPLLRWHHHLAKRVVHWSAPLRVIATLGSESYAAWGEVPRGHLA